MSEPDHHNSPADRPDVIEPEPQATLPGADAPTPLPATKSLPAPGGDLVAPVRPFPVGWGAAGPAAAPLPALNALTLLLALRQRWKLALLLGLLAAASASASAWYLAPRPTYKARAMVHLSSTPERILRQGHDAGPDFSFFQKTQLTVVKSQLVLKAALKQPQVAELSTVAEKPSPLEWLTQEIEADFSMGPEILSISLAGDRPQELVVLVNAVMRAYLDEFVNEEDTKRRARLEHLKGLRAQRERVLKTKQQLLEKFAPKLGDGDPKNARAWLEMKVKLLGQARDQLLEVQREMRKQEIDLKGLEQARARAGSVLDVTHAVVEDRLKNDPLIGRYGDKVAELTLYVADIREKATSPEVADDVLRRSGKLAELEAAKKALEARRTALRKELQEKALADLDAAVAKAQNQALLVREHEKALNKVIAKLEAETHEVGKESFDMGFLRSEVEEEAKVVRQLAAETRALEMDLLAPSRARPLDEAIVAKVNGPKRRLLLAGGAGGLGLALALVGVAFWSVFSPRVRSVDEVACGLGVRLVGTLPAVPARERGLPVLPHDPAAPVCQTHYTASVDSYRTMLLHEARAHAIRVVMVTSAVSGEGKTSLASQLVVSLARAGRNALLVDGDLRNPTAHRIFGLSRGPGLSELLRGEIDLAAAVRPAPRAGAWIMTAGQCDLRAIQCLGGDGMRDLFKRLREQFDFVVVDSSPVLAVADALMVGQHVDGVIFSVLCDVSRMPAVAAAQHRLALLGIPTLGAAVIGSGADAYSPHYHYHYPLAADRQSMGERPSPSHLPHDRFDSPAR
ncbi:MAG TPA: hypothetical protein VFE78_19505 [Gemmataceae bacterium]|nr:hypothetical protein [Gemmataceae bacterium]